MTKSAVYKVVAIFAVVLLLSAFTGSSSKSQLKPSNKWLVAIGISDYKDSQIRALKYADDDVISFKDMLIGECNFPSAHVQTLVNSEATYENIRKSIASWLGQNAKLNDLVVIYFSGHGTFGPDQNSDEDDGIDEFLVPYDAVAGDEATAIRDDYFSDWTRQLASRQVIIILDSCYSGGAAKTAKSVNLTGKSLKGPLTDSLLKDVDRPGTLVMSASKADETSQEWEKLGHGVFTYYLLEALTGSGDLDGDGAVDVQEMFEYASRSVRNATLGAQNPDLISGFQEKVYLTGKGKGYVIYTYDKEVIIDLGSGDVKVGDYCLVFKEKVIKHPVTEKNISIKEKIGKIKIKTVNRDYSVGEIIDKFGTKQIEAGDRVEKVQVPGEGEHEQISEPEETPEEANRPDLTVEGIGLYPEKPSVGEQVEISALIKNIGQATAKLVVDPTANPKITFEIDDKRIGWTDIKSLGVGSSQRVKMPQSWKAVQGEHEIKVTVDPDDSVKESNEENNTLRKTINITAENQPPTMTGISVGPSPITPGQYIKITHLFSDPDNDVVSLSQTITNPDGAKKTETFRVTLSDNRQGSFTVTNTAPNRSGYMIIEVVLTDEAGNKSNRLKRRYRITQPSLPDLELKSKPIAFSPIEEEDNCGTRFSVEIKNSGNTPARSFKVNFLLNGEIFYSEKVTRLRVNEQTKLNTKVIRLKEGQHELVIKIDPGNLVKEANEGNNQNAWLVKVTIEKGEMDDRCLDDCEDECLDERRDCKWDCWYEAETDKDYERCVDGCDSDHRRCEIECKNECREWKCTFDISPS